MVEPISPLIARSALKRSSLMDDHPVIKSLVRQAVTIDNGVLMQLTDAGLTKPLAVIEFLRDRRPILPDKLYRAYADAINMAFINLDWADLDTSLLEIMPADEWRQHRCIPVKHIESMIELAMGDPNDSNFVLLIQEKTGCRVQRLVAIPAQIDKYLAVNLVKAEAIPQAIAKLEQLVEDKDVIKFCQDLVLLARQRRSSDIHIEALRNNYRVRFRIDGQLLEQVNCPTQVGNGMLNYFKVAAGLNIAEKRLPQDGRLSMSFGESSLELRISTIPTVDGEKMVLRILDQRAVELDLETLNFSQRILVPYRQLLSEPHGIIIATGPTGSGKTTTLYASLMELANPQLNITTIEDPVEYRIGGMNQIQVHKAIGLDFNRILRSCLRQDPDVVLVGEMRDAETAETAVRAALTGHLVLSSLHTNDAPGAIARLVNMGLPAYLIAQGLRGVVSQRLVRRICQHCCGEVEPDLAALSKLGYTNQCKVPVSYAGAGCDACGHTGFMGRLPIQELLVITDVIKEAIGDGQPLQQWLPLACEAGYRPLIHDALVKTFAGLTTIQEVAKLVHKGNDG